MSVASTSAENSQRFDSVDAVRGTAMLFVFLSHFTSSYLWQTGHSSLATDLAAVSMIASPTFVIVSGMVVGFMAASNAPAFLDLRIKLVDRGVFLLVVGHTLLALTQTQSLADFPRAFRTSFITDAIGVAVIVGPWLINALRAPARIAVAAGIFVFNWFAVIQWHPVGPFLTAAKKYVVGVPTHNAGTQAILVFPFLAWFAVYLIATVLGERVGTVFAKGDRKGAQWWLAKIGGACLLIAISLHSLTKALRHTPTALDSPLPTFLSIYQKFPPGAVYLAFFGGAGIVLLATIFEIDRRGTTPRAMSVLRSLGRASFFAFVAQYALYGAVLRRLALPYTPLWPLLFVLSIIVLTYSAVTWDRHRGNRFLTVGITALVQRIRAPRGAGMAEPMFRHSTLSSKFG